MGRDASTYSGGKKAALYHVTVSPKEGGKALLDKRVLADNEKDAKEKVGVTDLLVKKGLKAKQVSVVVEKVTDIK
jgi:hypothetical protein